MASPDDDDVALEHAHGRPRLPGTRARSQSPRLLAEARASVTIEPRVRRALTNGAIAAIVTLVVGSGIVAGLTDEDAGAPSPSPSP